MDNLAVKFNFNKRYANREEFDELTKNLNVYGYIYLWENLINGHLYVGQVVKHRLDKREKEHIRMDDLEHSLLEQAIEKYGEYNFERILLDVGYSEEELDEREIYWIAYYDTFKNKKHYNSTKGGNSLGSGENHPNYGKKFPEISAKLSGENNPMWGKKRPDVSGENNPMKRPEVIAKFTGKNNPKFKGYVKVVNKDSGELIYIGEGTRDIERNLLSTKGKKIRQPHISNCLNGKSKSAGGYVYSYCTKEEYENWKQLS